MKVIPNYILVLNFVREINHKHLKNTLVTKAKPFMLEKRFKKNLYILEDGASKYIEHVVVFFL